MCIRSSRAISQSRPRMECLVCAARESQLCFTAREQLFATNESFDYFRCRVCGSLQIDPIPPDIGRHYPSDYYSITAVDLPITSTNALRRFVRAARTDYYVNRVNLVGWAIDKFAHKDVDLNREWFRGHVSTRSRILDVGCGYGELLRYMHWLGFSASDRGRSVHSRFSKRGWLAHCAWRIS